MNALLAGFATGSDDKLYVDDVFCLYTRTGTGADATITTGVDMTQGYLLWSKGRSEATGHALYDSARGATYDLVSNSTAAQTTQATGLKSVSGTGYTVGSLAKINTSSSTYVDWTFRKAPKFFHAAGVTKSSGSNATVDLSSLGTVGIVAVKRTDSTGSWYVWHRSLTAGKLLYLEQTAAEATLGHISVSGTTLTLVNGVIADGAYIVYAWAHDASADGIVQCGSFTTDGSGNATVNLGWEPQYVMLKNASFTQNWNTYDSMRGMPVGGAEARLFPNSSAAEDTSDDLDINATGFTIKNNAYTASKTVVYLAIRRPNKPPTSGTQVYNAIAHTGTGANNRAFTGVGFPPDVVMLQGRSGTLTQAITDRLRGAGRSLVESTTGAEVNNYPNYVSKSFDMDGYTQGDQDSLSSNVTSSTYINHFFRRAPGVFDVVCWKNNNTVDQRVAHSLGVPPELIITKTRNASGFPWNTFVAGATALTQFLELNTTSAVVNTGPAFWGTTATSTTFGFNSTTSGLSSPSADMAAYLWATCPGITKVGSYTGNGSTQNIDCGFSSGARFILIKRTDSTGDWYVWDSVRGIVAANDPHLSLNSTAAEVTTDDSVDPYAAGFTVNQVAATNINVTGATYIFLAYA